MANTWFFVGAEKKRVALKWCSKKPCIFRGSIFQPLILYFSLYFNNLKE